MSGHEFHHTTAQHRYTQAWHCEKHNKAYDDRNRIEQPKQRDTAYRADEQRSNDCRFAPEYFYDPAYQNIAHHETHTHGNRVYVAFIADLIDAYLKRVRT